jgi:hypothetical protein
LFLFDSDPRIDLITYVDSDLFFFDNPEAIFEEMGSASIMIVAHRFPPAAKFREINGIYNVGWVSWKSDERGRACLEWYRERTLEWCCDVVEETRFADQKYLDDWPVRFPGVRVLQHKGCNVAPFNIENYRFSWHNERFFVDDQPLIFYHFHGLSSWYELQYDQTGIKEYLNSSTHSELHLLLDKVYRPYIEALCNARDEAARLELDPHTAATAQVRGPRAPMAAFALPWREYLTWSPISPTDKPVWEMPYFFPEERRRAWHACAKAMHVSPNLNIVDVTQAKSLATELVLMRVAATLGRRERLRVLDWGGARDHVPAYRIMLHRRDLKLGTYVILGAGQNRSDITEAYPKIKFADTLEQGLAFRPHIVLVSGALVETPNWYGKLARLATGADILVLDDVRTLNGTDALVAMRRPTGSSVAEPAWILNRKELMTAFQRLALIVDREFVWLDPVRLSYIPELADRRTFVLRTRPIRRWTSALWRRWQAVIRSLTMPSFRVR